MVCLGNEQRSFCRFWDCMQVLHFVLFCCPWWLFHFFWGIPARSSRYNGWWWTGWWSRLLVLSLKLLSSTWLGAFLQAEELKGLCCYINPWRRNRDFFPLFLHSLTSWVSNCLNLPFGIQGRSSLFPTNKKQGHHRKAFYPGLLPENQVCLLVLRQQTQPSQSLWEGTFDDYLQQVRRTPGIFPKAVSPQTAKLGKV